MESFGLLIVALGVALANLPAAMQQWRADRAGFTKTIELLAVYLVYCLLGGGLILWLASRGEGAESPGKALEITGVLLGWILYGALTLMRVVPRYSRAAAMAHAFRHRRHRRADAHARVVRRFLWT